MHDLRRHEDTRAGQSEQGLPGVTFPGGHVELGEAFTDAVRREVKEETGLDIFRPTVCGINDFIRDDGTRYIVLFFRADRFSGELKNSAEGRVFWIERDELTQYKLSQDFIDMVHVVENPSLPNVSMSATAKIGRRE